MVPTKEFSFGDVSQSFDDLDFIDAYMENEDTKGIKVSSTVADVKLNVSENISETDIKEESLLSKEESIQTTEICSSTLLESSIEDNEETMSMINNSSFSIISENSQPSVSALNENDEKKYEKIITESHSESTNDNLLAFLSTDRLESREEYSSSTLHIEQEPINTNSDAQENISHVSRFLDSSQEVTKELSVDLLSLRDIDNTLNIIDTSNTADQCEEAGNLVSIDSPFTCSNGSNLPSLKNKTVIFNNNKFHKIKSAQIKNNAKQKMIANVHVIGNFLFDTEQQLSPVFKKPNPILGNRNAGKDPMPLNFNSDILNIIKDTELQDKNPVVFKKTFLQSYDNGAVKIDNVKDHAEMAKNDIYGMISYHDKKKGATKNYIKLKGKSLICYESERVSYVKTEENKSHFVCLDDTGYCYVVLHTFDLRKCSLFVAAEEPSAPPCYSLISCCQSKVSSENLQNIISLTIYRILEDGASYQVFLKKDSNNGCIKVKTLKFILYTDGLYHTFEPNSMTNYMKWINAIQVRYGG